MIENVNSYIQNGNVIFDTKINSKTSLNSMIEAEIEKQYEFHVPALTRFSKDLHTAIKNRPFPSIDIETEGTQYLVSFISQKASKKNVDRLLEIVEVPDKCVVVGTEVCLHCPNGYAKRKLSNNFIEKKLEVMAITRNWKTINKLAEMAT